MQLFIVPPFKFTKMNRKDLFSKNLLLITRVIVYMAIVVLLGSFIFSLIAPEIMIKTVGVISKEVGSNLSLIFKEYSGFYYLLIIAYHILTTVIMIMILIVLKGYSKKEKARRDKLEKILGKKL